MQQTESSSGTRRESAPAEAVRGTESRRRMLRRSLGVAAPVVLTLTSAPVSAGMCVTASSFVSASTFASRQATQPSRSRPCNGLSPTAWAESMDWPVGVDRNTAVFREVLDGAPISGFLPNATLLEVLQQPNTLEACVAAVWLSAYSGGMPPPFEDGDAVKAIWANIRHNNGAYNHPDLNTQPLTPAGTREWLAMSWQ
ncbi:hypothetical protein [Azohydromonas australica]|uniref:hypothetical protein n=1 Tax=Azohydromonas australica TaxID=364039 RepID=UPI0012EB81A1|nr:hypothetical protein [Azohydromonas australica]